VPSATNKTGAISVARAKALGKYKGRKPSVPTAEIRKLKAEGMGVTAIADRLGILQDE
jgi:DNA invertase Pin-like site-specific DNA recombinase